MKEVFNIYKHKTACFWGKRVENEIINDYNRDLENSVLPNFPEKRKSRKTIERLFLSFYSEMIFKANKELRAKVSNNPKLSD